MEKNIKSEKKFLSNKKTNFGDLSVFLFNDVMENKEQCGDVGKETMLKKTFIPDERDMLRWKNYVLQETVGEGTYSKVKVEN